MAEVASAYVSLLPSARNWGSQIDRQVGGQLNSTGRGIGSKLGGAIGRYVKIGAAAGIAGAGAAIFSGLKSAAGLQQITTQTSAVLKSTGGAAGVTAKQVRGLANEINNYSTLDDDAVQSGENLLLTFTNIRNEAGKGNDIFTQTTKVMADMSTALGQDTKSSALQLGKALNDPVKGVTALQRVGVSFTQDQKDQIKTLVDSGKTLKAQKLILAELGKEFGGSAKKAGSTFAGAMFHLKDALSDTLRDALLPLLPGLTSLAKWAGKVLPGAMKSAIGWVKNLVGSFTGGGGVGDAAGKVSGFLKSLGAAFLSLVQAYGPPLLGFLKALGSFIATNVLPVLKGIADFITGTLAPALGQILAAAFGGLKSALQTIGDAISDHRTELSQLLNAFKQVGKFVLAVIVPVLKTVLPVAFKILGKAIGVAIGIISGIVDAANAVAAFFTGPFARALGGMVKMFVGAVKFIANAALSAFGVIVHGGSTMLGWVPGVGPKLRKAAAAFDFFKTDVLNTLTNLSTGAGKAGTAAGTAFGDGFTSAARRLVQNAFPNGIHIGGSVNTRTGEHHPTSSGTTNRNGGSGGHLLDRLSIAPAPAFTGPTAGSDGAAAPNITINNPVAEPASESIPRVMREQAFVSGAAWT